MNESTNQFDCLEQIYEDYLRKVSSLKISASSLDHMFNAEWHRLHEQEQKRKELGHEDDFYSMPNFTFRTVNNDFVSYDLKTFGFKDSLANLIDTWNRHYQILLVQAFEAFSKFMKAFYAKLIRVDSRFKKPNKNTVHDIRRGIFKVFPELKIYDTRNQLGVNFKFMLPFIANLRHRISHTHGEFNDFNAFKIETLNVNGLYHKNGYSTEFDHYFESFVRQNNNLLEVAMMPFPKESTGPHKVSQNRFDMLNDNLMAYVELIHRVIPPQINHQ